MRLSFGEAPLRYSTCNKLRSGVHRNRSQSSNRAGVSTKEVHEFSGMRYGHGLHGHPLLPAVVSLSADKVRNEVANRGAKPSASTRRCCRSVCAQEPAFPDLGSRLKRNLPIESCCRSCAHLTTTEHVRDSSADLGTAAQAPSSLHSRVYAECESALSATAKKRRRWLPSLV